MLRAKQSQLVFSAEGLRFAIVAGRYNQRYSDALVTRAQRALRMAGAKRGDVTVIRVPGAFEVPVVVSRLASSGSYDAIIALGVIIRGETEHADLIGRAVTDALTQIVLRDGVPVVHEVLLLGNEQQAHARCLQPKHNRGTEAALTAIEMAHLMRTL
ncbi:MAG: 6,7-dimethyl-8-ribityllumazine synthase [Verrucomicrobia bacterium GWF2_62_7]|nr:MAG: 6,7-dimethyl-8-ribityllumazine synthase [Verrucomicrobia bacterium GWF2_62_7]